MSAINPASFQTPISSLGLTPAFGNPGYGGGVNDNSRRGQYNPGNPIPQFEDTRSVPRGGMPPPFYPQYQPNPAMAQRMGLAPTGYGANMQPGQMDPFAGYGANNFGMFGQGQAFSRQDARASAQAPNPQPPWMEFQGLSMH